MARHRKTASVTANDENKKTVKIGGRTSATWPKGIPSPNPKGRPRTGETWRDLIQKVGDEEIEDEEGRKLSRRERIVRKAFEHAGDGALPAYWKELMDRANEETPPELMLERLAEKYGISKEELAKDQGIAAILRALGVTNAS